MVTNGFSYLLNDPGKIFSYVLSTLYMQLVARNRRVTVGKGVRVFGLPIVNIHRNANLLIGNNVTLNSRNYDYFINMHSPVKLFADAMGAKIVIGDNSRLHGVCIHANESVVVGDNCLIAGNSHIIDSNGHEKSFHNVSERIRSKDLPRKVMISDNVWIGANSFVLPGVTIGEGSIIGANSVVAKNVPPMVIATGNPAVVVKSQACKV